MNKPSLFDAKRHLPTWSRHRKPVFPPLGNLDRLWLRNGVGLRLGLGLGLGH